MKNKTKKDIDMCSGSQIDKMIWFAIPLMLTSTLQLFYNAADIVVVGNFAGKEALSAVGSTGALINLLVNIFTGISVGVSVVVSNYFGSNDFDGIQETVHTAIAVAIFSGIGVGAIGLFTTDYLLLLMNTPLDVIDKSSLYVKIYFLGMPFNMVCTFGLAIIRAIGDTKRPLYYLSSAGIINVILNLIFVIKLNMSVAGVALATIISQFISMVFVIRYLTRNQGAIRLDYKKIKIHNDKLTQLICIGLPAGIQGSLFSLSNVIIQSTINTFGATVMAGNAAASNIAAFIHAAMSSIQQTTIIFSSQNMGAKQFKRVRKTLWYGIGLVIVAGNVMSLICMLFANNLVGIYNSDPEVIRVGVIRLYYMTSLYFIFGIMDTLAGQLRAVGYSFGPMLISLGGVCFLRVIWIYFVFPIFPVVECVYVSYPFTWIVTALILTIYYNIVLKKIPKENQF